MTPISEQTDAATALRGSSSLPLAALAQDRSYGRSMVASQYGIVATSHYLASQAGAALLARGGSSMDAAIAANAVLGVTEPMTNGIGGDLFLIHWEAKTRTLHGLNASGWAPRALTIDFLRSRGFTSMPGEGIHSVTVPGAVAGWSVAHQRLGRMPWRELFAAAVFWATEGCPVPEIVQDYWRAAEAKLHSAEAARVFLPGNSVPETGQIFRNPDIAAALGVIAEHGSSAFYRGQIAEAILETSSQLGGTLERADLEEYSPEWVQPISTEYRGWTIFELPPNGQGLAALEMLNIMAQFEPDAGGPHGVPELHKKIEAMKLAYADLYRYNADPRFAEVPVGGLLSRQYAAERAALIFPDKAAPFGRHGNPNHSDTTYLAAVDREGNITSLIQSNFGAFGSGVVPRGTGFILQNRGGLFALDPSHPDSLAPRKRPFHTIIPGFMERGDLHIGFGIMGGPNQPLAHAQFVSNVADYGMNVQQAMEAPRFTIQGATIRGEVLVESRIKPEVLRELRDMGHKLVERGDYSTVMGRGQAVLHNSRTGINFAGSDPRSDGCAEPEPPEFAKSARVSS